MASAAILPGRTEEVRQEDPALAGGAEEPCPGPIDVEEASPVRERVADAVDLGEQG